MLHGRENVEHITGHWSWGCTKNYEASFEEQSQRERKGEKSMRENGSKSTEKYMSEKGKALGKCGKNRGKQAKKATLRSNLAQTPSANVQRQTLFLTDPLLYHLIPIHFLYFTSNFILFSSLSHFSTTVPITLFETKLFYFLWEQRSLAWLKLGSLSKICAFVFMQVTQGPCRLLLCSWLQNSDGGFGKTLVSLLLISLTSGVGQLKYTEL